MDMPIILGDWGTTACRLHLVQKGRAVDGTSGPGIKFTDDPAKTYADMVAGWEAAHGPLPALLCGTVGANIGWRDASYVTAPSAMADIVEAAISIPGRSVTILPGVRTDANAFGHTDVMRSEEIQVFGWLASHDQSDALLCLPGSHTKWVEVENGTVQNLTTGFVGELFETLSDHSILTGPGEPPGTGEEFARGVGIGATHAGFPSALFSVRAEAAQNRLEPQAARDRLSGILIGADCAAMLRAWGCAPDAIIGGTGIATAYQTALKWLGHDVPVSDGDDASLAGLIAAWQTREENGRS